MIRLASQQLVETGDGRLRLFLMEQTNTKAQLSFVALRIRVQSLLEGVRGFRPAAQLLIADAQIEAGGRMPRRVCQQSFVGFKGVVELLQLELNVSLGGQDLGGLFA